MRPSRLLPALLVLVLVPLLLPALSSFAQPLPAPGEPPGHMRTAIMVELAGAPAAKVYAQIYADAAAAASAREVSATTVQAAATAAAQAQLATITAAQAAVRTQLAALEAPELFAVQRVYNGIAVLADQEERAVLARLPGVAAVHTLAPKEPANSTSIPFLGIPALWQAGAGLGLPNGLRGEGVRIAIIDTGIDYLHRDFGGPGSGYLENDRARVGDIHGFPGPRVVGGYDFVGDSYNATSSAGSEQQIPRPDPDPMDCFGHGTHVAGTAAGSGVTANRQTYTGPYDETIDYTALHIGPGIAPRASIYALKIFGCFGSTNLTDLALEWAVDPNQDGDFSDRMDVANLSLGSSYGWEYDTSAVAANNAALVGVIVVASAGNNGDIQLITSAPASAERAISVAATQHAGDVAASFSSRGPRRGDAALKPDIAAPGATIVSADHGSSSDRKSSSGTSMAAPHVTGVMALLRQAHRDWSVEELKALAMNTAVPLVTRTDAAGAAPLPPVRMGAGRIDPQAAVRARAVLYAAGGSGQVSVSFGAPEVMSSYRATQDVEIANKGTQPASYAVTYNSLVELPGVRIEVPVAAQTVAPGSKVQVPVTLQVDAAALKRRQAPADKDAYLLTSWFTEESGQIYLWDTAVQPPAPLTADPLRGGEPSGTLEIAYAAPVRTLAYTITLPGIDATAVITRAVLGLGLPAVPGTPLADLSLAELPPAGSGKTLAGSIALDAAAERWLAAGLLYLRLEGRGLPGSPLRGQLLFAQPVLHLPVYAAPRPAAEMHAEPKALSFDAGSVQAITLTGRGIEGSAPPTDVVSLASVMELKLRSPNTRPPWLDGNAPDRYDHADLQYVGVTSDAALGVNTTAADARLYFGVATWADWSTPNEVKINILIDMNGDGVHDYRLANSSPILPVFGSGPFGPLVAELYDGKTGAAVAEQPLNGVDPARYDANPFFTNVLVLPVKAADLGITAASGVFTFVVQTTSTDPIDGDAKVVDRSPVLRYDPQRPALQFSQPDADAPLYRDRAGTTVEVRLNPQGYPLHPVGGVLVLHLHNRSGSRASSAAIDYRWPWTVYLPIIDQRAAP